MIAQASLARVSLEALALLAPVRSRADLRVRLDGSSAWVRWDGPDIALAHLLLQAPGATLYEKHESYWRRCGSLLPVSVPEQGFTPASGHVLPQASPVREPLAPPVKATLGLRASPIPRPAHALLCVLADATRWAALTPDAELSALLAARAGGALLLLGDRLPPLPGTRFWGDRLLSPLGFEPDPPLPESTLLQALGAGAGRVLLRGDSYEVVPAGALQPLSRAALRLAGAP